MAYFWRKRKYPKGDYYQICLNEYDSTKKQARCSKTISLGYKDYFVNKGINDIDSYLNKEVERLNEEFNPSPQIEDISRSYYLGHFLMKMMFDYLDIGKIFKLINCNYKPNLDIYEFFKTMCYAQCICPGSKYKLFENVIPNIYGVPQYSYDQILDNIGHIGLDYPKYIEILNDAINKKYKRDTSKVYFDCTNYFFEIDLEDDLRRKGPSKENRKSPIIGQALMLDSNGIPIGMDMYSGNLSEKPYIRQMIEEMKNNYDIQGKTIQIADKGLNCAKNIYAAVKEANDGYIFSKSIHGKGLSQKEKIWLLLNDDNENKWTEVKNKEGKLIYKYKSCIDEFEYSFEDEEGKVTKFIVKEKRVITYSPTLAKKKKLEIQKEIEKAMNKLTIKEIEKKEFGDSIKYVNFITDTGEEIKGEINLDKVKEDISLAGYNMLVTSETSMDEKDIYNAYHGLWRIEHFFRILKTYLAERPVYVQKHENIYGHFLIGYYIITLIRLLELYVFKEELCEEELINFIRQYNIAQYGDDKYVNISSNCNSYRIIKKTLSLLKLGNVYLSSKDINNILSASLD